MDVDVKIIVFLLIASGCLSIGTLICGIVRFIKSAIQGDRANSRTAWYLLAFVLSIWSLRYAVGYYSIDHVTAVCSGLSRTEEVFNSLIHTFQTFSMDEDYTSYISAGKTMIKDIGNGEDSNFVFLFGIYASVLNMLAPICGGAILLNILQGVSPRVKLFFKRWAFWKKKFYFSKLNERSLTCAKSILKQKYHLWCKPIIVFTDVYTNGEDELSSELYKKARANGAICLQDDITHLNHRHTSKKEYWLIDENEIDNIKTLAELSSDKHFKNVAKTTIRIFYQNDSYVMAEKKIVEKIRKKFEELSRCRFDRHNYWQSNDVPESIESLIKDRVDEVSPPVIRIRCYQNLIYNLLEEEALFLPLINRDDPTSLDVAIIGNGNIGMEMFLSTYWCGQLLDIPLSINVIAKDDLETACAKINKINSDILESSKKKSDLLRIYPDGVCPNDTEEYSDPYFTFRYCQADLEADCISETRCYILNSSRDDSTPNDEADCIPESIYLIDTDYILVALGDDDLNIRIAEELAKTIAVSQLNTGKYKDVTIACVVYDTHLAASLNDNKTPFGSRIRMRAIGSLDDVYSWENIMMYSASGKIGETESLYNSMSYSKSVKATHDRMEKLYDYWSSYANSCHYSYKSFSAFIHYKRNGQTDLWEDWVKKHQSCICVKKDELAENLAWLEHRRWNAYMRSIGFKHSNKIENGTKNIDLKIHSCIVECKKCSAESKYKDCLDLANNDVKKYDYIGWLENK